MKHPNIATQAIWAGENDYLAFGATQVPVVHSVSFGYDDMDDWYDVAVGKKKVIFMDVIRIPLFRHLKKKLKFLKTQNQLLPSPQGWLQSVIH